jgi:hypothetical protein
MDFTVAAPQGVVRPVAWLAYGAAVLAFLLAQELGLRLRREETRAWWAGSGRDLLNVVGLVAVTGALRLLGFAWPAALLVGGSLTLTLFGASVFVATQLEVRRPRAWAIAFGVSIALPPLVAPGVVAVVFATAANALFRLAPPS